MKIYNGPLLLDEIDVCYDEQLKQEIPVYVENLNTENSSVYYNNLTAFDLG